MSDAPMMADIVALHGRASSIVLERRAAGAPLWRWWGGKVDPAGLPPLSIVRPDASYALDVDQPLDVAPGFGVGWFGPPALLAHRDGRAFTARFDRTEVTQAGDAITILLFDAVAGLRLEQRIALDPATDVATLSATLTNEGDTPLDLLWLAAGTLPLPGDCTAIRGFTGRHNHEFQLAEEAMPQQSWVRESRRGIVGHAGPPGLFVSGPGAGWHAGRVHGAQLAWSGNHRIEVARDDEGLWTLQMGEWLAPGEIRLSAGEAYATPEMLVTCSSAGLNGALQAFHAAVRARAPWPEGGMKPRPVHLNSWEALYFAQDEARMMALAERAAALGVERFVIDDGWFTGRADDTTALGDWTVDTAKYPNGLAPLAAYVRGLGMEFGLWVEPEMISPDSDLYRAHPDWALAAEGRPRITSRSQLVLDLGQAAVRDYLFEMLGGLLRDLPIAYLKWDHNRALAPAAGQDGRAGYHAQVLGFYALLDRLGAAHPAVEIESCAGGGGRIDAGVAARTHRFWPSDCIDAVSRVATQRGFLHFMPPEMMGTHVGASPAHATARSQAMAFRAAVALPGHFGVELDPGTIDAANFATLSEGIARYKALRDRLHRGAVWLGEGTDNVVWQAHGAADAMLLIVTRTQPSFFSRPQPLPLPPLAGAGRVRVRLLHVAELRHGPPDAAISSVMQSEGVEYDGDWLAQAGLPLPAMQAESVALFEVSVS